MRIPILSSVIRKISLLSNRQVEETPQKAGPRESVKKFLTDLRRITGEKEKQVADGKETAATFHRLFLLAFFTILLVQNISVALMSRSSAIANSNPCVKKDLINDLVIRETTIDGNLKGSGSQGNFSAGEIKGDVLRRYWQAKNVFPSKR